MPDTTSASEQAALPTVCILAGGLGTRLGERGRRTPKPLIEVAGAPFLFHQLALLSSHGAKHAVVCVGHLGEQIEARVGAERFGMAIEYSYDGPGLDGTLGAIRRARGLLGERFLVLYGDTYLRVDYAEVEKRWRASGLPAVMTVLHNAGRWDTSNAAVEGDLVVAYDKVAPTPDMAWIDYGLGGLSARCLDLVGPEVTDLSALQHRLASEHQLLAFRATERFYEIGTPEALEETDRVLRAISVLHAADDRGAGPHR